VMEGVVHHTDLLSLCAQLEPASVDMVLVDLPYGTTRATWDSIIPFDPMWTAFKRIIRPRGAIVMTASQPFTSALVMSNPAAFRHEWIWEKDNGSNFLNTHREPFKTHESVLVFGTEGVDYWPCMEAGYRPYTNRHKSNSKLYGSHGEIVTISSGERFPKSILRFARQRTEHPTAKPVDLFRYLIRTYTRPGDLVVDPCVGSGTTALAARAEGRRYIVGDSSAEYCEVARKRLDAPYTLPMLGLFAEEGAS
jgi:site-specific DNA-methyltransferase (adenine-specific)